MTDPPPFQVTSYRFPVREHGTLSGAIRKDVEQPPAGGIDQAGDELGVAVRLARSQAVSSMPSAPTPFQPRGVIDQGLAAAADGRVEPSDPVHLCPFRTGSNGR
jgi:hypothetical protein